VPHIANTAQQAAWNGYEGAHCAAHPERYEDVDGGVDEPLLAAARLTARDRVLDVGCGTGGLTRRAAAVARSVRGIDLSEPMLATARRAAAGGRCGDVAFSVADAQVHPFAPGEFDVVLSRYGVMFFADPVAGFANLARALRPGGRLAAACRDRFARTDLGAVFTAMAPHIPFPTGPDGSGPSSLADPDRTRELLGAAGFAGVRCARVEVEQRWGADVDDAAEFLAGWGPVRHHLAEAGPAAAGCAREAMRAALARFAGPDGVRLRGSAWLITAERPA